MEKKNKFLVWKDIIWKNKYPLLSAIILFIIALNFVEFASTYVEYVDGAASSSDIILDNLGPYNITSIFVVLTIILIALFYAYPLIFEPENLAYYLNMSALFIIVRAIFISLTHLQGPLDAIIPVYPHIFSSLAFVNDLFFSGHTGFPFLGFLMFKNKYIKGIMLLFSITMAVSVLVIHAHYSIDVFAAFFITYGIYKIGNTLFYKKSRKDNK